MEQVPGIGVVNHIHEALLESERRFRALVTASNDIVFRLSPDWSVMLQLEGQGFLANTENENPRWLQEYIPDTDRAKFMDAMERAIREKSVFELEHRVFRSGGAIGWARSRAVPLLDSDGSITEWFGSAHDITERVFAEVALQDARDRAEADLDAMTRLRAIGDLFVRGDPEPILTEILEAGIAIAQADFGNCQLLDSESGSLKIVAHRGFPQWWLDYWAHVAHAQGACGTALASGERTIIEDVTTSQVFVGTPHLDAQLKANIRAVISTPLIGREGKPLGMLSQHFRHPIRKDERILRLLDLLARQATDIIERMQVDEERSQQARYAEALNRINDAAHSSLDSDEIMDKVIVQITEAMQVDATAVHMRAGDHWEFTHSHNLPDGMTRLRLKDDEAKLSAAVRQTLKPIVSNDVLNDDRANVVLMERFGITAVIGVPLIVRGEAIGVLFTGCLSAPSHFSAQQIYFMNQAAAVIALALENAKIYQTEHDISDRLQAALLVLPDEVRGIEFSHAYHSASEEARVGGDFYDVFEIGDDHVALCVGDVAGKGLPAAVLTSMVKHTIRAHAHEGGKSPAKILELTNELVYSATPAERFVTVFLAILDCRDGRMVYSNAGHTTAAIAYFHADASRLPVTGPILGAVPHIEFQQAESHLDVGDVLFLYTDGLTEARRDGELYAEERVFDLLAARRDGNTGDVVASVVADVLEFSRHQLRDDLAILAIKRVERGTGKPEQQKLEV